jgi:hypothetical protein
MRLPIPCIECAKSTTQNNATLYLHEIEDTGIYNFDCLNGHNITACLQEERFEVLYELAANAIIDGYYREAIASFTGSLEAFREFYLRVAGFKAGVPFDRYHEAVKSIFKFSERVLGAYTVVYAMQHKGAPPELPQRDIELRNQVIHAGKFPTREEALLYGQNVGNTIHPVLTHLKKNDWNNVQSVIGARITKLCTSPSKPTMCMTVPGIISITRISPDPLPNLVDALEEIQSTRRRLGMNRGVESDDSRH